MQADALFATTSPPPPPLLEPKQRKQVWHLRGKKIKTIITILSNTTIRIFRSKESFNHWSSWRELPLGTTVSSAPGQMSEPVIPCQQGPGWVVGVGLWAPESYLTRPLSDSHLCELAYRSRSPVRVVKYSWRCTHCHLRMSKVEETWGRKNPSLTEALIPHMVSIPHAFLVNGCAAQFAFRRNLQIVHNIIWSQTIATHTSVHTHSTEACTHA